MRKYIEEMYDKEYLYFNCLKSYRSNKLDKTGRLDPRETNLKNRQLKTLTLKTREGKEIPIHKGKQFNAQYMEHIVDPNINCCSLHWIDIEIGEHPKSLTNRLVELGDTTLLIYDWKIFLEKLDKAIEIKGLEYSRKKVTYYSPELFDGDLTLHHKDEKYKWQNEYRILISPTDNKPLKLNIPGLNRISVVIETKKLNTLSIEIDK